MDHSLISAPQNSAGALGKNNDARIAELVPDAIETLAEIMETGNDRARTVAAIALLDRAGYGVDTSARRDPLARKNLAEMTSNDLAAIAEKARLELLRRAEAAKVISGDTQPIETPKGSTVPKGQRRGG